MKRGAYVYTFNVGHGPEAFFYERPEALLYMAAKAHEAAIQIIVTDGGKVVRE